MNRLGVALAADSATTITYWEKGERKQRYFKGANKIFNLSAAHPVGLMTYDAGTLQGMPWEVIVKAYRDSRGSTAKDSLAEYAQDFFKFLANKNLFPPSQQESKTVKGICETAGNIAASIMLDDQVAQEPDTDKKKTAAAQLLSDTVTLVAAGPFITPDCSKLVDEVKKSLRAKIGKEFESGGLYSHAKDLLDIDKLIELAIEAHFKERWTDLEKTGIVIAGFGDKQFFPSIDQFECFGVALGRVIYRPIPNESRSIDFDTVSEIVPIAQDEMVNTFMFGASIDALATIGANFAGSLSDFVAELVKAGMLDPAADTGALQQLTSNAFREKTRRYVWDHHATPLRRVVGMLPVGELAELAETLVSLESLKERVTRHTESVSGPIDVAVISKGDGFIWIKRKHYFDPKLNIRFVARRRHELEDL